jgi:hypothetical protein
MDTGAANGSLKPGSSADAVACAAQTGEEPLQQQVGLVRL